MARARYYDVVQFPDPTTGLIHKVNTVQITVYQQGTTTLLADTIYRADTGVLTYTNPRTIVDGVVEFYLDIEKRVSIKFDATGSGYGIVTKDFEPVWPDPASLRQSIRSADGSAVMQYDTEVPPRLVAPGLLSKHNGWDCEVDFGMTPGGTAATNAALFQAGVTLVAQKGGGDIKVNEVFNVNPIHLNHNQGSSKTINLIGQYGRGGFQFTGTAGPFFQIGSASGSFLTRSVMDSLLLMHNNAVNSGATIQLGQHVFDYTFDKVKILNRGRPDPEQVLPCEAAFIGIQAAAAFRAKYCKIELRTDQEFISGTPIGITMNNGNSIGGPFLDNVFIDGCLNKSAGFRLENSGVIDNLVFNACHFKDHEWGFLQNSAVGPVINSQANAWYLDGITGTGIFIEPVTGGSNATFNIHNSWIAALDRAVWLSDANGGTVTNIHFMGGYWTDSLLSAYRVVTNSSQKIYNVGLHGVTILSSCSTPGEFAINFGASDYMNAIHMHGNTAQVVSPAGGAARFSTAGRGALVTGNLWVGVNAIQGFVDDLDSVYANNRFINQLVA